MYYVQTNETMQGDCASLGIKDDAILRFKAPIHLRCPYRRLQRHARLRH